MADYQYQPDMNDPVAKLRVAMDAMDGVFIHIIYQDQE
jgi:general transcription factor 3C polypeptide 5 (transcription factor C subunit 1)